MFATFLSILIAWGSVCATVVAPVVQTISASYQWREGYLYYGSYLVGCHNGHRYYGWDGAKWVDAPCPVEVPKESRNQNFGLDLAKIHQGSVASVNGQPCSKEQAFQALEKGGKLLDDSSKLHLTVYGEGREGVLQDLDRSPQLSEFKGKFLVQSYPGDHWAIAPSLNYPTPREGKPVILVQTPDGKVVHSQRDYDAGSAALAKALAESLRRPVPHTDPNKFPDLSKGVSLDSVVEWLKSRSPVGVAWWVLIATVLVIYYINNRKPAAPVTINVPTETK